MHIVCEIDVCITVFACNISEPSRNWRGRIFYLRKKKKKLWVQHVSNVNTETRTFNLNNAIFLHFNRFRKFCAYFWFSTQFDTNNFIIRLARFARFSKSINCSRFRNCRNSRKPFKRVQNDYREIRSESFRRTSKKKQKRCFERQFLRVVFSFFFFSQISGNRNNIHALSPSVSLTTIFASTRKTFNDKLFNTFELFMFVFIVFIS